jgi:hypothetical protein
MGGVGGRQCGYVYRIVLIPASFCVSKPSKNQQIVVKFVI